MATPLLSANILQLEVESNEETIFTIDCGPKGIKNTDEINIKYGVEQYCYNVKENNEDSFYATLTYNYSNESSSSNKYESKEIYKLVINKKTNAFTYSEEDYYEYSSDYYDYYYGYEYNYSYVRTSTITFKGTIKAENETTTITLDSIHEKYMYDYKYNNEDDRTGENSIELECSIVLKAGENMPTRLQNYKSISDITEEDMKKWIDKIEEAVN